MKIRKKKITPLAENSYNYCDCPFMNPTGRGCNALVTMICRTPGAIPCGFYPKEKQRRKGIKAE